MTSAKSQSSQLIIEQYPADYVGYPFITLIQYRKQPLLTIVNNRRANEIDVYVLDMCKQEGVSEEAIVTIASEWYENSRNLYPLSIEFANRGIGPQTARILRSLNTDNIVRIIGPVASFPMDQVKSTRRRKHKLVAPSIIKQAA